ncbi:hypothetical protein [Paraburkholderia sp. WC7.3d]|uniref:hypothetical protein n=1 Tax=Paraburkholderia TaxID=1822464 RepID=UPI001FE341A2|nr:hypothetical protein [Paraburkholderia podalyriae]
MFNIAPTFMKTLSSTFRNDVWCGVTGIEIALKAGRPALPRLLRVVLSLDAFDDDARRVSLRELDKRTQTQGISGAAFLLSEATQIDLDDINAKPGQGDQIVVAFPRSSSAIWQPRAWSVLTKCRASVVKVIAAVSVISIVSLEARHLSACSCETMGVHHASSVALCADTLQPSRSAGLRRNAAIVASTTHSSSRLVIPRRSKEKFNRIPTGQLYQFNLCNCANSPCRWQAQLPDQRAAAPVRRAIGQFAAHDLVSRSADSRTKSL